MSGYLESFLTATSRVCLVWADKACWKVPRVWAGAASQSAGMRKRDPIACICRRGHRHWLGSSTSISM